MTQLSVVIAARDRRAHLRGCLESLKRGLPLSSEVLVIDDGSRDGSARMVADEFPHVRLVQNAQPRGRVAARNQGVRMARGAYVLFLDPDTRVEESAVRRMLAFLEVNLRYGAVTARFLDGDGATRGALRRFPNLWTPLWCGTFLERLVPDAGEVRRHYAHDFDYDAVSEVEDAPLACLLMRRRALGRNDPLDESLGASYCGVDLCRSLWRSGWRIAYLPDAWVTHFDSLEFDDPEQSLEAVQRDRLAYYRKHHGRAAGWWLKACVAFGVAEGFVRECYRRAEGFPEEPLAPLWQGFAGILRA